MIRPPVIQIVGYKNSGKTTLIKQLLSVFNSLKLRVAVIKHDVHGFEIDHEGTDTYAYRQQGAAAIAITSPYRTALIEEQQTPLEELIERFGSYDLILVEGFKQEAFSKIVMLRNGEDQKLLQELDQVKACVMRDIEMVEHGSPRIERVGIAAPLALFVADEIEKIAVWILGEAELVPLAE
ncbi:molybdopterin-guanine dinucleotide biosynthesis protein B [Paenibacillus sp. D2_2]|uniref:molybdopterin-guanine dinucleotide biosynthesis protein B n=1 Tax=Paenibacillus sp. D2_2 TaxID=3073092 RepID=UPI0028150F29|nr:molybdopterin-guanine dinucleotide biosynthesis protein B [Paenibacillus sp. D2_2]WMT42968.1 molybdopterin-guanine dinucleotide biosynthesis protein B [Paenibacillus sp. D2_2]